MQTAALTGLCETRNGTHNRHSEAFPTLYRAKGLASFIHICVHCFLVQKVEEGVAIAFQLLTSKVGGVLEAG